MKIAFLGNYPPKACGIGTFTNSLARAILSNLEVDIIADYAEIIALEDPDDNHAYPEEVTRCIRPKEPNDYRETADYLNNGDFDLLVVQHEYGIFGGDDGAYVLHLLDRVRIPVVVTFHTVLKEPSFGQRSVLRRVARRAQAVVVMSELAKQLLNDVFGVREHKIHLIEHGVPVIDSAPREEVRRRMGWGDAPVLFTFGLLGRGKGIETSIRALPIIAERYPNVKYVVLGKTHPHVLRTNGEEYREYLQQLAEDLGVGDNLEMIARFASEQELFDCLRAADVYIVPYPNEAQITSGTLAYAVGAGAGIVSTPFWHAAELLREGRGRLFDFHDDEELAESVIDLLDHPEALDEMRRRAADYGKQLLWPRIGKQYLDSFTTARERFDADDTRRGGALHLPPLKLDHLLRLTDDVGIVQHAKFAVPNRFEGYCLDDNGRALLLVSMMAERGLGDGDTLARLADTYLAYIYHAQNSDGTFRNFMAYDRRFLETKGSEDSYGRALWGVSYCMAHPPRHDQRYLAKEIFDRAVWHLEAMSSPRTIAYGVIAISHYLNYQPGNEDLLTLLDRLCDRLIRHYNDSRKEDWNWFEAYMTYSNGILPYALFKALGHINKESIQQTAEQTSQFLADHTIIDGVMRPIGCVEPYVHRGERPRYDQQPVDVMCKVLLFSEACRHQDLQPHCEHVRTAFAWFTGQNDMKVPLYNENTGGCMDGLLESGLNQNQGAESVLAYLISRVELHDYCQEHLDGDCSETDDDEEDISRLLSDIIVTEVVSE